jgi:hypothetical protein
LRFKLIRKEILAYLASLTDFAFYEKLGFTLAEIGESLPALRGSDQPDQAVGAAVARQ